MKRENTKEPISKSVITANIFLTLFTIFCIFLAIIAKSTKLIPDIIGLAALILTINLAARHRIGKEKVQLWSIISLVLLAISIPLMISKVIYSFVLSVPSLIIAKKLMKKNSKPLTVKIAYFGSLIIFLLGIAMSIVSIIMNLVNNGL